MTASSAPCGAGGRRHAHRGGDHGRAEVFIILLFAAIVGGAFLWALVLHPPDDESRAVDASTTTTVPAPGTPVSLPPPAKMKITDGVNFRQGPATNTEVIRKLETGTPVLVECRTAGQYVTGPDGSSDQWLRITVDGATGYVSALYVDVKDALDDPTRVGICPAGA